MSSSAGPLFGEPRWENFPMDSHDLFAPLRLVRNSGIKTWKTLWKHRLQGPGTRSQHINTPCALALRPQRGPRRVRSPGRVT